MASDKNEEALALYLERDEMGEHVSRMLQEGRTRFGLDFSEVYDFDPDLATTLITHHRELSWVRDCLVDGLVRTRAPGVDLEKWRAVLYNLPYTTPIRKMDTHNIGHITQVDGMVVSMSDVQPMLVQARFICPVCDREWLVPQKTDKLKWPGRCECDSRKFVLDEEKSMWVNNQIVTLQENHEELPPGMIPRQLTCRLTDDLVDSIRPGDRSVVVGVIRLRPPRRAGRVYDYIMEADHVQTREAKDVEVTEEDLENIRRMGQRPDIEQWLVKSVAPTVYGYDNIKRSMLYLLVGGMSLEEADARIRGNIHVLLVGDPGVAKSQLLTAGSRASPRGLITAGKTSTSAGLTATVQKDPNFGRYVLEAGALVLADRGVCCIEENQFIVTPFGISRLRDLRPGTWVGGDAGGYVEQEIVHNLDQGVKPTLRVHLYTGDVWEGTADHEVETQRGWILVEDLTPSDSFIIPTRTNKPLLGLVPSKVTDQGEFEDGFIHGFSLCDVWFDETSSKNRLSFSASEKKAERSEYVASLINKHYGVAVGKCSRDEQQTEIKGKTVTFSPTSHYFFSSRELKESLIKLFNYNQLPSCSISFKLGFLAGVLSTDTCVAHKKGAKGVKHEIVITLGRRRHGHDWLVEKMKLVNSLFHQFGILSVYREKQRRILITSLRSINRAADILGERVVSKTLTRIEPKRKIRSYDDELKQDYVEWFKGVKWRTSETVRRGLHSRIWAARKNNRVTCGMMETLRPHWEAITSNPYREPIKNYMLNPVRRITPGGLKRVRDLTIRGQPNFWVSGGIVHNCIDEIDKMEEADRGAIHFPMEQQSVPIAKGGIVATLNARTSILAAANPKYGRYDNYHTVADNIDLPVTILTRFDLIWVIKDTPNQEHDGAVATHILNLRMNNGHAVRPPINLKLLKKYIGYASKLKPKLSQEANDCLKGFYLGTRMVNTDKAAISITARSLEAATRISEARAKLHLRETVTREDAEEAVKMVVDSLQQVGVDSETGELDADVIYTGRPRNLNDRLFELLDIIRLNTKTEAMDIQDLYEITASRGWTRQEVDKLLGILTKDGMVFYPRPGKIRAVNEL